MFLAASNASTADWPGPLHHPPCAWSVERDATFEMFLPPCHICNIGQFSCVNRGRLGSSIVGIRICELLRHLGTGHYGRGWRSSRLSFTARQTGGRGAPAGIERYLSRYVGYFWVVWFGCAGPDLLGPIRSCAIRLVASEISSCYLAFWKCSFGYRFKRSSIITVRPTNCT